MSGTANNAMRETRIADAFAACLDDIEHKGASLEQCLGRYPDLRVDLEPVLRTILNVRAVPPWQVSPEFKATARQRIVRRIRNQEQAPSLRSRLAGLNPLSWPGQFINAPVAVRLVSVFMALFLLVGAGSAIASSDTQPDSPLHQIKLATESLELKLSPAGEGRSELLEEILDRRASELLTMSWQDKADGAQRSLVNYQAALHVGHTLLDPYNPADSSARDFAVLWQEALARNVAVLQGLVDTMPAARQAGRSTRV